MNQLRAPERRIFGRTRPAFAATALAIALGLVGTLVGPAASASAATNYQVTATVNVGAYPAMVAANANTNTLYVVSYDDGTVSAIDGATNAVTRGAAPSWCRGGTRS